MNCEIENEYYIILIVNLCVINQSVLIKNGKKKLFFSVICCTYRHIV